MWNVQGPGSQEPGQRSQPPVGQEPLGLSPAQRSRALSFTQAPARPRERLGQVGPRPRGEDSGGGTSLYLWGHRYECRFGDQCNEFLGPQLPLPSISIIANHSSHEPCGSPLALGRPQHQPRWLSDRSPGWALCRRARPWGSVKRWACPHAAEHTFVQSPPGSWSPGTHSLVPAGFYLLSHVQPVFTLQTPPWSSRVPRVCRYLVTPAQLLLGVQGQAGARSTGQGQGQSLPSS